MTIVNDTRLVDLLARVAEYGKADGKGQNSKPAYAMDVIKATIAKVIASDHADSLWSQYSTAAAKAKGLERARTSNPKVDKVRTSETRTLINFAGKKTYDGAEVMERATDLLNGKLPKEWTEGDNQRPDLVSKAGNITGSTWQNMVVLARKQLDRPAKALDNEEIVEALGPEKSEAKTELDLLRQIQKRMTKVNEGDPKDDSAPHFPSEELSIAIEWMDKRIAMLELTEAEEKTNKLKAKVSADKAKREADEIAKQKPLPTKAAA